MDRFTEIYFPEFLFLNCENKLVYSNLSACILLYNPMNYEEWGYDASEGLQVKALYKETFAVVTNILCGSRCVWGWQTGSCKRYYASS